MIQSTLSSPSVATSSVSLPEPTSGSIVTQLSTWRDLDESLSKTTLNILARIGVPLSPSQIAQFSAAEIAKSDKPPEFVRVFLESVADKEKHLQFVDEHGARKWVRLTDDDSDYPDHWRGVAVSEQFVQMDRAALLVLPGIYQAALQDNHHCVHIPADVLGAALWSADRARWPRDWIKQVLGAIETLATTNVEILFIPRAGWPPQVAQQDPAVSSIVRREGELLHFKLDPEFVGFLRDLMQAAPDGASTPKTTIGMQTTPVPEVNAKPEAELEGQPTDSQYKEDPQLGRQQAVARCYMEARVVEQAFPALVLP